MKVCIAEKPSVAREIANILGASSKKDGFYEGNGYAVTYTFGHLCTLNEPVDYKSYWKYWNLDNLPMLPKKFSTKVVDQQSIKKQFNVIKSLLDSASLVINCGDAGQEGELIQRWVINKANYLGPVKRLWISSLTAEAIKDGFNNLKPGEAYNNLFYAGYSRAIGDWLLGINATRLYTLKYGQDKQVLSVGRVQTPTLSMVVQRHLSILNFKPEPYWELQTVYKGVKFNYTNGRFTKKEEGLLLANKIANQPFSIDNVVKKDTREAPPRLFDLTGLQVYCNTKFGLSAEETLQIAQSLYEKKLITYPRVDTTYLSSDIYPKVEFILKKLNQYHELTQELLIKPIKKSSKVFNDKKVTDHHAIIPTGETPYHLNDVHLKVYDIITKRFIAVFYDDCKIAQTTVYGSSVDETFKTNGKQITENGWRVVFGNTEKENNLLPIFELKETGPHSPTFEEKATTPPKPYTEATLLRAMETAGKQVDNEEMRELMKDNGIGRPSTRANIIETLFKRKYLKRSKKQVLPTQTGIQLIELIQNELLKSPELTGVWEKQLKDIEKGNFSASAFIQSMKKMVDQLVCEVRLEKKKAIFKSAEPSNPISPIKKSKNKLDDQICPSCKKGNIIKGKVAYGCSNYKEGCNFKIDFKVHQKKISESQFIRLISKNETVNLKGFKIDNEVLEGKLILNKHFQVEFIPKYSDNNIICPKCKVGKILKGKSAYGCSNHNKGCNFLVTFDEVIKQLPPNDRTKETVLSILEAYGKTL